MNELKKEIKPMAGDYSQLTEWLWNAAGDAAIQNWPGMASISPSPEIVLPALELAGEYQY